MNISFALGLGVTSANLLAAEALDKLGLDNPRQVVLRPFNGNVASEPACAGTKQELSARLLAVLEKTKDPRLTDAFDKPPYATGATAAKPKRERP